MGYFYGKMPNNLLFKNKYRIPSARREAYNYSKDGFYFVTICTKNKELFFGDIINVEMQLSAVGKIIEQEWMITEEIRKNIKLHEFVIMPNHLHGIIQIKNNNNVETPRWGVSEKEALIVNTFHHETFNQKTPHRGVSTGGHKLEWQANSLGSIINQIKSICTKKIWKAGYKNFAWQTRFHDRIIRNDEELNQIRYYIENNSEKWELDCNNPKNIK